MLHKTKICDPLCELDLSADSAKSVVHARERYDAIMLTQEQSKTMGIVCVYLAEILLKLTLGPISTRSHE